MSTNNEMNNAVGNLSEAKKALLEKMRKGLINNQRLVKNLIPKRPGNEPVPLSFPQQRLWFLEQLVPGSSAYNVPVALKLTGKLDYDLLEKSINEVIKRHESLRTVFKTFEGEAVQVTQPSLKINIIHTDLRTLDRAEREPQADRILMEESKRSFNLELGPLLRVNLLCIEDNMHILLINVHHIIADTWSVVILFNEMAFIYKSMLQGSNIKLPELPIQYPDYAYWQKKQLAGAELERQMAFWRERIEGAPTVISLPTDKKRPAVDSFHGGIEFFSLTSCLAQKMKELCLKEGITLYMLIMSAFQIILFRYSGQDDILVGTPIANRTRFETEGLIGFFSNTLVLRGNLSGNPTFREFAKRIKEATLEAFEHQEMPFEKLVDELQIERDMSRNPLFQVMFVLQNTPKLQLEMGEAVMEPIQFHNGTSKFDLWLSVIEDEDRLEGAFEYNSDIFEADTIKRIIGNLKVLLEGIVSNPGLNLSDLPILTEEECNKVLVKWNDTYKDFGQLTCLHNLIENQVELTPDSDAVVFEGKKLSYRELNNYANQLAHYLINEGVGEDVLVGVCMERSLEMVISLLGIIKAGGAYVPLDPAYPIDRLNYMLKDSDVPLILTQDKFTHLIKNSGKKFVCIDTQWSLVQDKEQSNPSRNNNPESLAYLIYTSGSTGLPKGSLNTHKGICNRLLWMQDYFKLDKNDRVMQKTPYSFDVSVWEFFWPLIAGACMVVAKPEGHKDSTYLIDLIKSEKITTIHFVPSMLRVFLEEEGVSLCNSLKRVICSGEALPYELQQQFFMKLDRGLYNLYGPTEAAVDVTYWECVRQGNREIVPIGKPVSNCRIYILDEKLRPAPIGVPGELHIGGICLSRGYLNREDLTNEKFIPDIFSSDAGSRLYKTGDLARFLHDGNIEYLGRLDHQVKIRGFRIELGEIEEILLKHNRVLDAVVVARNIGEQKENKIESSLDKKLVAYVRPDFSNFSTEEVETENSLGPEQVEQWKNVFEMAYEKPENEDPRYNFVSWNSSYTGEPIPIEEMKEWVEGTCSRIESLKPQKVLEIGCGTGLILFRIAPQCEKYVGTDISQTSLDYIEENLAKYGLDKAKIKLYNKPAHDNSCFENEKFDTVILNSVVQYFPDINYLAKVLERLKEIVEPGGHIFIGDVRNNLLLEHFHSSVELFKAHSTSSLLLLKERLSRNIAMEEELTVKPEFFREFGKCFDSRISVRVLLKDSQYLNEMSKFRYDVIIKMGKQNGKEEPTHMKILNYADQIEDIYSLEDFLAKSPGQVIGIKNIKNGRLSYEINMLELLKKSPDTIEIGAIKEKLKNSQPSGIDPDELRKLGKKYSFDTYFHLCASGIPDCYDAFLVPDHCEKPTTDFGIQVGLQHDEKNSTGRWDEYANNPLKHKMQRQLLPELKGYLKQKLPDYMIPSFFVYMDSFPVNSNGKLDRKALPEPQIAISTDDREFIAPRTPVEQILADIWCQVLGIDRVSVDSNFFELGGDSILSIRVIARANNNGVKIAAGQLFKNPTIESLAREVILADNVESDDGDIVTKPWSLITEDEKRIIAVKVNSDVVEDAYPLGPLQQFMLHKTLKFPEYGLYVMQKIQAHLGELNVELFEKAFQYVGAQNPIMRTSFLWEGLERPMQLVHKTTVLPFKYEDLHGLSYEEQRQSIEAYFRADENRGLELEQPKPFRLYVARLNVNTYMIVMTNNYLCIDGWSLQVLMEEVYMVYNAMLQNKELRPYPQHRSYRDFIAWCLSQDMNKAEKFWKDYMRGFEGPMPLAASIPGNIQNTGEGYFRNGIFVSETTTKAINLFAQRYHITPNIVVQAAWTMLLGLYSGLDKVCYGILVSGRPATLKGVESIMGTNLNIVPYYIKIEKDLSILSWLKKLLDMQLEVSQYENIPLLTIGQWAGLDKDIPLFENYIIYQNVVRLSEAEISGMRDEPGTGNCCLRLGFPLRFDIFPTANDMLLFMTYNRKIFDDATILRMLAHFKEAMENIIANPSMFVGELCENLKSIISKENKDRI